MMTILLNARLAVSSGLVFAGVMMLPGLAMSENAMSDPVFVFLKPETSSFWNTATNCSVTVPIDFPLSATSANLSVRGTRYAKDYENITASSFTFDLPAAVDVSKEDVYELTLNFVGDATVRTARLGLVQGLMAGTQGETRVLQDTAGKWKTSYGYGVMPVPQGAVLAVNGKTVESGDKGFTGAQGWYALGKLPGNTTADLELDVDDVTYTVVGMTGFQKGFAVIVC